MHLVRFFYKLIFFGFGIFLIAGCSVDNQAKQLSVAESFLTAVKTDDIDSLVAISAIPMNSYDQDWESAQDGIGFVLGKRHITRINNVSDLTAFFTQFTIRVDIQGDKAVSVPENEYIYFKPQFADAVELWKNLDVYLFLRGEADVEHIVLIGIQPDNNKIQAIYTN